ncbi:hypothetical protein ACIBLA_33675 [Streptomyces sp. NPDC050433]|uniref:hypothetical protein n=1 Tax=Streptomyces sp. NPDC050433 TaxID=3365615 RepID=UPI00379CCC16
MRTAAFAAAVVLVTLAGCSAADEAPDTSAYTDGTRVPKVEQEEDIPELPLARYEFGDSETQRMTRAQARTAQRCMADFGFADFPLDPALPDAMNIAGGRLVAVAMATPFGELDLDEARRWGYGWDPKPSDDGNGKKDRAMTDAEYRVFHNVDRATGRTLNGREVPEHGCSGQAAARLTEGVEDTTRMWTYASSRSEKLAGTVRKDPDVSGALRTWAACVEDKGFKRYEGREEAFRDKAWHRDDDGNTRRTQRERDTAVADIECAREHNTVGVWWAGEARAQSADVETHRAAYEAVRRDQDVVRANVRDMLGN